MALCRRCSSVFGIGLTTYISRFVHSGLQRSATLRLKSEIGLSGGRTIMSRYYDGPVPIKERKPKPVQQKTVIEEPEPQMAGMATSQLATSAGTQDSLAKAPTSSTSDALESRETLQSVLEDLESGREIRQEVLKLVERSKEYAAYEKDVHFEMSLIRRRYAAANEPMTPIRRTQMQAHLAQVQQAVMQEHAEKAAVAFADSLSKDELAAVQAMFGRLEGKGVGLEPHDNRTINMSGVMETFNQLCDSFMKRGEAAVAPTPASPLPQAKEAPSTVSVQQKDDVPKGSLTHGVVDPKLKT